VTSSVAVFEAATWVKINAYDKFMIENQRKKIKYGTQRNYYINFHPLDG